MTKKTAFFEAWSWFKFNNLGMALRTNLKFYTSVAKGLKLKVRRFLGLFPTFVDVTVEKLVGLIKFKIRISQLIVKTLLEQRSLNQIRICLGT